MSHPVDIHVGQQLKRMRILRNLTQTDVAQGLKISFQQVQKYELGQVRIFGLAGKKFLNLARRRSASGFVRCACVLIVVQHEYRQGETYNIPKLLPLREYLIPNIDQLVTNSCI